MSYSNNDMKNSCDWAVSQPKHPSDQALLDLFQRQLNYQHAHRPFKRVVVGLSGGLDSVVLLHLLKEIEKHDSANANASLSFSILALHINHHLQPAAEAFVETAQRLCKAWEIPLQVSDVEVDQTSGTGCEAAARAARYDAFEAVIEPTDLLLLGHHADDQIETFFLHLLRSSGPDGLRGMPQQRAVGVGRLLRPLLDQPRQRLLDYAQRHHLEWVEDPTNQSDQYDRNFLRNRLLPPLFERWPHARGALLQVMRLQKEAQAQLQAVTQKQFQAVSLQRDILDLSALRALDEREQIQLLRHWFALNDAPFPGRRRLTQALHDFVEAAPDRQPHLIWSNFRIDRYGERLYLRAHPSQTNTLPSSFQQPLFLDQPIECGEIGTFELRRVVGRGIAASSVDLNSLVLRFRRGGERLRPSIKQPRRRLKDWLSESNIPPWERELLPLLVYNDEVVSVGERIVAASYNHFNAPDELGYLPLWRPRGVKTQNT
jgi:tRNA(Ile)-lysidine synthase